MKAQIVAVGVTISKVNVAPVNALAEPSGDIIKTIGNDFILTI